MQLTAHEKSQLDDVGFLVLERFMDEDLRCALHCRIEELFAEEGDAAGSEFKQEPGSRRLANLVDKGEVFLKVLADPKILAFARHVLGPEIKLSSMNARSAEPGTGWVQPLHADMAAIADGKGYWVFNVVWLLDDFTRDNGAMRFVPGSHRWGNLPQAVVGDIVAPHPEEVILTAPAGSVMVMNAHVWHGGLANESGKPRLALHTFYCRRDKPQQQHQKEMLRPAIQERLTPELRWLLSLDECGPESDVPRSGFL